MFHIWKKSAIICIYRFLSDVISWKFSRLRVDFDSLTRSAFSKVSCLFLGDLLTLFITFLIYIKGSKFSVYLYQITFSNWKKFSNIMDLFQAQRPNFFPLTVQVDPMRLVSLIIIGFLSFINFLLRSIFNFISCEIYHSSRS